MRKARPSSDEVEHLLLNARLRDELEPFLDESVNLVDVRRMSTPKENEFLASMLAWERAPILPIGKWLEPELTLPHPDELTEEELHKLLWKAIHQFYDNRIVLEFTDHLSDRELYTLIYRDILPSLEKKIDLPKNYLHWHGLDYEINPLTWLRYYASDHERETWATEHEESPPPSEPAPYPRRMPRRPQ